MIKLLVCGTYKLYDAAHEVGFIVDVEVRYFEADYVKQATQDAIYEYRRMRLNTTDSFGNVRITSVTINPF